MLFPLLLSSCSSYEEDLKIATEVSDCGAIAQILYSSGEVRPNPGGNYGPGGSKGGNSIIMFRREYATNYIYEQKDNLILSSWFQLERNSNVVATIEWSFDKDEYVNIIPPLSDKIPHLTVAFTKFPADNEKEELVLTGVVTYGSASVNVYYDIVLDHVVTN